MNSKVIYLCNLIIVSMILSGCGSRAALNQRNFILEASRNRPQQKTGKNIVLSVQNFHADMTFSNKNLVYRKGPSEYETDFYNQFLISPSDMITEKTRSWLSESGLFKLVLEPGSYADATHSLEGNILALYGDFRDKSSPKATMKIRFFMLKLSEKSVVFAKTYEVESKVSDRTAESLIEAFEDCLTNILSDLEEDLQELL
ncbi:MAG: ABC-type transport auxiliary lipoprotein family protein [Planctomycetota bacterium]